MGISPHRAATSHRGAELYHLKTQRLQTRAREARREVQPAPAFNQLMHLNNSTPRLSPRPKLHARQRIHQLRPPQHAIVFRDQKWNGRAALYRQKRAPWKGRAKPKQKTQLKHG